MIKKGDLLLSEERKLITEQGFCWELRLNYENYHSHNCLNFLKVIKSKWLLII